MDKKAIEKARSRLRVAERALAELPECKNHDEFTDQWYVFLVSAKNIYTVLEQGAKASAQSRQWYGAKAAIRRGDDLLQYVYEARNDDEHGLDPITTVAPARLAIGGQVPGFSRSVRITSSGVPGSLNVTGLDGLPVHIVQTPAHAQLAAVMARGGRVLQPPTTHLGKPLPDSLPLTVGRATLDYLTTLLDEAARLA